jgi:two-component system cell cycle response regulator
MTSASELNIVQDTKAIPSLLIVEDNEQDSKLIKSRLQGQPYSLLFAKNGKEALFLLEKERIDIILLDILLPDMSGFDICHRVNKMQENCNIQIILITCLQDLENKVKGAKIGVDDYLVKPVNNRELTSRISTLFKKKKYLDNLSLVNDKLSISDELTKLYNNSYFEHFIKLLVNSAIKNNYPLSLILIDIHKLTHINDNFGHIAGNSILRDLSNVIKKSIRDIDLAARCGSKEFAILLPYCLREEAEIIAKRIHTSYASHPFHHDVQIPIGREILNIKISSFPTDGSAVKELFQNAQPFHHTMKEEEQDQVFSHTSNC